ncbi:oxygen-independent coproporphyrinogen-3 oxidase [Ruminiclostridium sufflavum DSM 19573]|uniref:Oxygen-independent coproporphyrinogen-3 oxidase n=1 Tax=Ruminiclostridium sufflavum DSM 19573 TaxID=1121337 RepID=A0A318XLW1_9FIRM|nr:coproporphyrinogen dehydrogenase HemZ [Ruminiclostridium sufflavum]PYG87422.1 oxygen-independent coproporphyrinogen-3 oxidase [Ruminiclostridium sufflavum DSM 19573]
MIFYKNEVHNVDYEFKDIIKLFFMPDEMECMDKPWDNCSGAFLLCGKSVHDGKEYIKLVLKDANVEDTVEIASDNAFDTGNKQQLKDFKRVFKRKLFLLLTKYTGKAVPWGILTGIRPAKLVNEFIDRGMSKKDIISALKNDYFVENNKARLIYEVAENQRHIYLNSKDSCVSLYIGIPFCPTRCLYCSFSSSTLAQYGKAVASYVDALLKEIKHTGKMIKDNKFEIESIYIGGGTPTSLNASQLSKLLGGIEEHLDLRGLKEYTVEAGRPDTIDIDKLRVIRNSLVTRISINPQTMNAVTLEKIGRKHSPEDIEKAFYMARDMGFDNINMDLICGLPGEDTAMFGRTLERLKPMEPDSLTVHTMAIKRASRLTEEKEKYNLEAQYGQVSRMAAMAEEYARDMGLVPYYLYRQKNILGNLENVGYSQRDKECLYNIQIMEERQSVFACGAGAATKLVFPQNRIERAFNVKTVEEYLGRVDEMLERKAKLIEQYKIINIDNR